MVVLLPSGRVIGLRHLSYGEPGDQPGGLRVYLCGELVRDLDPTDSDYLRRVIRAGPGLASPPGPVPASPTEGTRTGQAESEAVPVRGLSVRDTTDPRQARPGRRGG